SVSADFTLSGGTFTAGTGTVSFGGGAATLNVTTADTLRNVTVAAGAKTIAAATTVTATETVSLNGGSLAGTGTLAAQGNINQASAFGNGTATLLVNGGGSQPLPGAATPAAGDLPALVINKPAGTLTLAGTIRTAHNWTYTAGTVDPGTSTVVFAGTQTISGSQTLGDVVLNNTTVHTIPLTDTLTVTGLLTLADGSIGTRTRPAQGAISEASAFDGGTGTLLINGAGAQTFTGAATTAVGLLSNVNINKRPGTLTLAGTIRTAANWTYTGGTVDPGTSTLVFAGGTITGSHTLANLDLRAST